MNQIPRLAVGTIQPAADIQPMLWALNECLSQQGLNVQNFSSHPSGTACCAEQDHNQNPLRVLDSWLLSEQSCQELFCRTTHFADIAVVSGDYDAGKANTDQLPDSTSPASLDTLCQQLDLARVVVLDASLLDSCRLPPRPEIVDGILLDRLPRADDWHQWQVAFGALWGVPVLGSLGNVSGTQRASTAGPTKTHLSTDYRQHLGSLLHPTLDLAKLLQIAYRNQLSAPLDHLFMKRNVRRKIHVAVALDEAFPCLCPDTLDLFESFGAQLHEFSPLHSDDLPPETELVYISCGHVETMATKLAANICLKQALQNYAARGGRVYAECDGLAYLCETVCLPGEEPIPLVGLLPATAQLQPQAVQATPHETRLSYDSWFGQRGNQLRAYWNPRWQLACCKSMKTIAWSPAATPSLVQHQQVVGNLAHLDFLAHPHYLPQFFHPLSGHLSTLR